MAKADQTGLSRSGRSFIEAALILLPHTRQDATMYLSGMALEAFPAVFGMTGTTAMTRPRILLPSTFSMSVSLNLLLLLFTITAALKSIASRHVLRRADKRRAVAPSAPFWGFGTVMARWMGDVGPPRSLRRGISRVLYRLALWIRFEGAEECVRGKRFDH